MIIFRSIILFYIGFVGHVVNVLADDLNIQRLLTSGFSINTSNQTNALYTVIKPFNEKTITRVLDGRAVVWESEYGERARAVTIVTFLNKKESLMNIEILSGSEVRINYYVNFGSFFSEVTPESYQEKLDKYSAVNFELHDVQVVKRKTPRKYQYDSEQEEQPETNMDEVNYELEEPEEEMEQDLEEEELEDQQESSVETQPRRSLRRHYEYDDTPKRSKSSKKDRMLDITKPEENPKVMYEYEVNDGTPTLSVAVKKGKKISSIYEEEYLIWQGNKHSRLVYMNVFADYSEFRLAEIFYLEKEHTYHRYFRRNTNGWEEVNPAVYEDTFIEMKKKIVIKDFIGFNISKPDHDKFYEKLQKEGKYNVHTYFPKTGYHLKQVGDGDRLIWQSHERRCLAVVVAKYKDQVRLLKLEILKSRGSNKIRYYKKKRGEYEEICEGRFEQLLKDESPGFESDEEALDREVYETLLPDIQEKLKMHDIGEEESSEETTPHSQPNLNVLQILNPSYTRVEDSVYRGVKYKTFFSLNNVKFKTVKVGENTLWKSDDGQYTQFLRMFYVNNEPKLGFLKLTDEGLEPKDMYFINEEGYWNFVTPNYFLEIFDEICDTHDQSQ